MCELNTDVGLLWIAMNDYCNKEICFLDCCADKLLGKIFPDLDVFRQRFIWNN